MSKLIALCAEEEERINAEKSDFAHAVTDGQKSKKIKDNGKAKNKANMIFGVNKASTSGTKHTSKCHHCKKCEHMRKNCKKFKDWLPKKGNDFNSIIYESLLVDIPLNTWWVDTGASVHITNSL
jgi:hypothetical protein